jgi:hypothetical protein
MGFSKQAIATMAHVKFEEKHKSLKARRYGVVPTFSNFDINNRYEAAIQK